MNPAQKADDYVKKAREAASDAMKRHFLFEAAIQYQRAARGAAQDQLYSQLADKAVACMVQARPLQAVRMLHEYLLSERLAFPQAHVFETLLSVLLLANPAVQGLRERYQLQHTARGQDWFRVFELKELAEHSALELEHAFTQALTEFQVEKDMSGEGDGPTEAVLGTWRSAQEPLPSMRLRGKRSPAPVP